MTKTKKVWHISRFRERYELPEDIRYDRKSPLLYTKDFVGSGSDDESCGYWQQLMAMRSKSNYLALRGAFSELKNIAGNKSKEYRGYLLDSNFEPASVKEIGRWLGVSEKKGRNIIEDLQDVGLLEYVGIPQFNGQPRKRTGKPGRARGRTGKSGNRRGPLKKKVKAKAKAKIKVKVNGKDNTKRAKERQGKEEPQRNPTPTTQPIKPQLSAKGGSVIHFPDPPKLKNTQLLGHIAKGMLHKYNPEAKQFAFEIYQALELPWELQSEMGRRELGCFASAWQKVERSDELRARAITEAKKVAKRRQNKKKGAVWVGIFQELAVSYSQRREAHGV